MSITEIIRAEFTSLSQRAQDHIRRTRPALLNEWDVSEEGNWYTTIRAEDRDDAIEQARENVDRSNYEVEGTLYIDVCVRNKVTGEKETSTVTLEPEEPECLADAHDWKTPYSVLGGIKENPGVWGNGGGVICKEVCAHCGRYRETNTWAQRHDTGEQGLTEVTYSEADEASVAWLRARQVAAVRSALADIIEVRYEDGDGYIYSSIVDQRDDDGEPVDTSAEDTLAEINEALRPLNLVACWTGESNTDADGESTSDISIELR